MYNGFTYDKFGNVLTTPIAGNVLSTNEYAVNNSGLLRTIWADGTVLENTYDAYGRIIANLTTKYDYNDSDLVVRSAVYAGDNTASENLESRMQYTYTKGGLAGGLSYQEKVGDIKTYTYTYAADELSTKSTHLDTSFTTWTYDSLRRNTKAVFAPKDGAADGKKLYTTLTYANASFPIESGKKNTTTLVDTYTNKFGKSGSAVSEFTYSYDGWGNIKNITDLAGNTRTYTYNDFSEVTEAVEAYTNGSTKTYKYTYDAGGNILTETVNGKVNSYVYDSVWKDKLISYNGKSITYDEAGHPLNYMGSTMTWDASDRLTSIKGKTANGTASNITYTYLSDGSRRSKTVDGVTTTYHYNNGLLLSQSTGEETLHFYYDSTGKVVSIGYQKGSAAEVGYFFTRNAQGDIVGVYRSSDSKLIGTYEYDLWGKPVSTTEATAGIDTDGILTKNPFRYRGYYFDEETGFYYLNARYYDSEVRRWISPEPNVYAGGFDKSAGLTGYNTYVYCANNPIKFSDYTGEFIVTALVVGVIVGAVVGGSIGGVAAYNSAVESGLQGKDLACATVCGVGKGALVGGVAGGLVGATGGAVVAYGAGSVAGTTMLMGTAIVGAKAMEVSALQVKKGKLEGESSSQITNDTVNALYGNGGKIVGRVRFTKGIGVGATHWLNVNVADIFGDTCTFKETLESPAGCAFSCFMVWLNYFQTGLSISAENPVARADERGYVLQ